MDEYQKSEDNFLNLLNKIETEGLPKSLESQREALKPLLDEFSQKEVSETKAQALKKPSQITSISLMGSKLAVASTKEKLASVTKEATELDLVEMQKQSQATIAKLDKIKEANKNLSKEELDKKLQEETARILTEKLPEEIKQKANNDDTKNLPQDQLNLINVSIQTAPNGDKFISQNTGLDKKTVEIAQEKLKSFNNLPEAIKDGRQTAGELISEMSQIIKNPDGISFNFGTLNAQANQKSQDLINRLWSGVGGAIKPNFSNNTFSIWTANWVVGGLAFAVGEQRARIWTPLYRLLINSCYAFWWALATCLAVNAVLASWIVWFFASWLASLVTCWGGVKININNRFRVWMDCL